MEVKMFKFKLSPRELESREQARIEAQSIIEKLEPEHINSWSHLIKVLEGALKGAKQNKKIYG